MIYDIELCNRFQKYTAKYGRIDALIPDASVIGTDNCITEAFMFRVIGSNEDLLISGGVCNYSFLIIIDDVLFPNSITFFLVYFSKA